MSSHAGDLHIQPGGLRGFQRVDVSIAFAPGRAHIPLHSGDKLLVSRFVDNAVSLLDSAESALRAGYAPSDMAILISPEGGIRMVADSDWPLESLRSYHGARTAYRISQQDQKIRVVGKDGSRTCTFESAAPSLARRLLLSAVPPMYSLAAAGSAGI